MHFASVHQILWDAARQLVESWCYWSVLYALRRPLLTCWLTGAEHNNASIDVGAIRHREQMDEYKLYNVVPRLVLFVGELTNIYVRYNRKRLKGGGGNQDALAALTTLYATLLTLCKARRPVRHHVDQRLYCVALHNTAMQRLHINVWTVALVKRLWWSADHGALHALPHRAYVPESEKGCCDRRWVRAGSRLPFPCASVEAVSSCPLTWPVKAQVHQRALLQCARGH